MRMMASQLRHLDARGKLKRTDTALTLPGRFTHRGDYCLSKVVAHDTNSWHSHGLVQLRLSILGFDDRLHLVADDLQATIEFNLVPSNDMIFEIVNDAQFVLNEVERNDSVLKLFVFSVLFAFVTAASQNWVDDEDWDSRNDENDMLENVDNQICV